MHRVIPPQVHDFALPFEHREICCLLISSAFKGSSDVIETLWCLNHFSQFSVICKLAEAVLCPIIQVIDEDVK